MNAPVLLSGFPLPRLDFLLFRRLAIIITITQAGIIKLVDRVKKRRTSGSRTELEVAERTWLRVCKCA